MFNRVLNLVCVMLFVPEALSAQDPATALRDRYLGPDGLPAASAYELAQGIAPVPGSESFTWRPRFRAVYRAGDVGRLTTARPVHTDCYFIRTRKYVAAHGAHPVWDGRVFQQDGRLVVAAYTDRGEIAAGYVDDRGLAVVSQAADDAYFRSSLGGVRYNPFTGQLWRRDRGGTIQEEHHLYLPLALVDVHGEPTQPEFRVVEEAGGRLALVARSGDEQLVLARSSLPGAADVAHTPGYSPVLGPGCTMAVNEPTVVVEFSAEIDAGAIDARGGHLVLKQTLPPRQPARPSIEIDGRFDDWRSVRGIADPVGDIVSYLQYNPDTDLLEFKVAGDEDYLYFYTRVAGRHGHTAGENDRYYFYVYIDADCDPATGYVPTRDDNCYFGVALGDDCEAQFEFIDGRFVKTFFGFAGASTEKDVLSGRVRLGPSWYNRFDSDGKLRDSYKVEYIRQADQIKITKDYAEGSSDDITVALSPDGSECEMRAALAGFLKDQSGRPVIAAGQTIDLAVGVEAAGRVHGNQNWGADSSSIVRRFRLAR